VTHVPSTRSGAGSASRGAHRLGLAGGYTVAVLLAMGLSDAFVGIGSNAFSLNAALTVLCALVSWTVVLQLRSVPRPALRSVGALLVFVFWLAFSMLVGEYHSQATQFVLVQISFAGTILVAAGAQYRSGPVMNRLAGRAIRIATVVLLLSLASSTGGFNPGIGLRSSAIIALVCASWFLAERLCGRLASTRWAIALVVGIGISLSRTALFAAIVLILVTAGLLSSRHKVRAFVAVLFVLLSAYWLVNYWGPLRDRFVTGDVSLSVGGVNVNTAGRTQVWDALWSDWQSEPIVGHGPGTASAIADRINPDLGHPHSDYLRILEDVGLFGSLLWVWFAVRTARLLLRVRARPDAALPARAALLAGLAVLILMVTDNPMDYSFVLLPLGVLIGLALGARSPSAAQGPITDPEARPVAPTSTPPG
jgi:O-antigen ligase